jgi:hypothetical protein
LKESQPDAAKIREQYDAEIKDLEAKHAKEVAGLKDDRSKSEVDREVSAFQSRLVSLGMDPDYAEVQAQKKADRFRFEDGKGVQIMQEGKEIPITAGDDKTPLDVLAEAVVAAVPARFINSKADKGTGHRTHQQGTGGAGGSVYDRIREDRKAEREKGGKDRLQPRDELSRRMNVSPTN